MKHFHDIKFKKDDHHIFSITLNRPSHANAYSEDMVQGLVYALQTAEEDKDVRVVTITGEGKHFCAGGDVDQMENKSGMFAGDSNELRTRYMYGIQKIPKAFNDLSVPVIAMVNGAAIGAGLDLACMCDVRIASEKATFGETFSKLALVPGDGGTYFLPRIVGYAKAMEMFLTGRIVHTEEAKNMGLISNFYSEDHLESEGKKLALSIARNSPMAVRMTKKAMQSSGQTTLHQHLDMLSAFQGITQRSSDHFEAISALKTKREPRFENR